MIVMWITKSRIFPDRLTDLQTTLTTGKFLEDKTFKWKIEGLTLLIESETKDIAHHRGMWFIHKFDSRMRYTIEEQKS